VNEWPFVLHAVRSTCGVAEVPLPTLGLGQDSVTKYTATEAVI